MQKFRQINDHKITEMFVAIGGVAIALVLLVLGLSFAENVSSTIFFVSISASLALFAFLFYMLYRVSRRPRFMFSL